MKNYLVIKNPGRLGNRMSEYATMFALNKLYNITSAMSTHQQLFLNKIFPSTLDIWLAMFSIFMSIIVGVISGIIPSYRAANLDPIDSLRYE